MTQPITAPDRPTPVACPKCRTAHDPARCKAHSKRQAGGQCQQHPMAGQEVCASHGGRAPQAKAAAAVRTTEEQIRKTLGALTIVPVVNPLAELQDLAGEAKAWKQVCHDHMAALTAMRYGTEGGEAIRGEIVLFERALDRCLSVLATIAKLNIDERLVRIAEGQRDMVLAAIEAGLAKAGVTGALAVDAKVEAARHLRVHRQAGRRR